MQALDMSGELTDCAGIFAEGPDGAVCLLCGHREAEHAAAPADVEPRSEAESSS